ncbi:MAG: MBL fold metallo-hydrolase [Lachnospiraceae bacterium]|nr:MBL fold metallo-hydrolase [Lachnospiraceae bacterium]
MRENLELSYRVLGSIGTNVYFVVNKTTRETVIIDPADEADYLLEQARLRDYRICAILLTHGHFDHFLAADAIRQATGAKIYAHKDEEKILSDKYRNRSANWAVAATLDVDEWLTDGQELELAGFHFRVIHTPGHTCGSCCYYMYEEGVLFSGDTLFKESYGRTDLPTGSDDEIVTSVQNLLTLLPEDTDVFPGHMDRTTIGYERQFNPLSMP